MKSKFPPLKTIINELNFLNKIANIQWSISELFATKFTEKTPDLCNPKEHYQSFPRKKNTKSIKKSKRITQQRNSFEKPDIVDIKSVIIKHQKTSHKLSKTIRQASIYSEYFLKKK